MTDSALLEKTDTELVLDTDLEDTPDDKVRHYFRTKDMELNALYGVPIPALCGYIAPKKVEINNDLPICFDCDLIMETIVGTNLPKD